MRSFSRLATLALALLLAAPAAAQDVKFSGQVRPRYESRDVGEAARDGFTSMRVRTALQAVVDSGLTIFVQVQDVRLWGEESSTLGDFRADNFDVHQAYIRYRGQKMEWLTATVGRQETNFGGQRLVGAVGWTQQGRSFDGARLDLVGDRGAVSLVAYTLADATSATHDADAELFGAYATIREVGPGALDLYLLYDRGDGADATDQQTFGVRYAFARNAVSGRFEASAQRGDRGGESVSAYMFGGRLGASFGEGRGSATLWYDQLSGDDDLTDDETRVFSTLYATNHKFYGFADLFLDVPAHTAGAGLRDAALKASWTLADGVTLSADLHRLSAVEQRSLSTTHFADELDVTLSHRYSANLGVTAGLSYVSVGDALTEIGRLADNMTWAYVMFDAAF